MSYSEKISKLTARIECQEEKSKLIEAEVQKRLAEQKANKATPVVTQ